MRVGNEVPRSIYLKRTRRNLVSRLKREKFNARYENWEIQEMKALSVEFKRRLKRKSSIAKSIINTNKKVNLYAPENIDYYSAKNYRITNLFLNNIADCILRAKRRVFLNFDNTEKISAAAMLSLLAQVEVLIVSSAVKGSSPISFSHPKSKKVKSILNQVGFYSLLKKSVGSVESFDDVNFWHHTSGECAEPSKARPMLDAISKEIKTSNSKKLYRGFIEAMANSVEHAYPVAGPCNKWWTFAGVREGKLVVVLCDKGVGIPATLPHTQSPSSLRKVLKMLNVDFNHIKDSAYIKAATALQNSSTKKKHRGKGLKDVMSVIRSTGEGYLSIFSNRGRFKYMGQNTAVESTINDYNTSINGTIIEWSIPLEEVTTV
ncbi:ATP-binding protein [Pseudoalteromonas sp. HM-SA03]|uniref:ATP-binding protein n=1 Tax=Pseudoalteromonas sp. HM-SA03 TaxID=2029678 RepID=UPI000BADF51E|nr:ATP-binding protein [Pseudoalteromonas sp. HM-SA03]PAX98969.1 ATP-binding protein [Pseudoalteromonas sp. HM-SA03]